VSAHHLLLNDQDILVVLELFVHVQNPDKVSDHRDLFLGGSLDLHLLDTIECVAHDSDQQVHEQELGDECRQDKEYPNESSILSSEVLHIKLSQANHVWSHKTVKPGNAKDWLADHVLNAHYLARLVKQEHSVAKHCHADQKKDCKRLAIGDDLPEHSDEGSGALEQSEPVEKLDVHHEDGQCTHHLGLMVIGAGHVIAQGHEVEQELDLLKDVPKVWHVLLQSATHQLDYFQDLEQDHVRHDKEEKGSIDQESGPVHIHIS